jgi:hypothetical protein
MLAAALLAVATAPAATGAQGTGDGRPAPYGSTLTFGTGLVTIPVAWVSPAIGDLFAMTSARNIGAPAVSAATAGSTTPSTTSWDFTQSLDAHFGGRLSLGAALYGSKNQQMGAYAQAVLVEQPVDGPRWLPSVAIGVRNLGSSKYQDRFVTGDRRAIDVLGDTGRTSANPARGAINGSPTVYAVATREFAFGTDGRNGASVSVGYGNGLFKEDGGLDSLYSRAGTLASGVFAGARLVTQLSPRTRLALMVDNNGFDWNAGATYSVGFVTVGVFGTELEEGSRSGSGTGATGSAGGGATPGGLANFSKLSVMIGYTASLPGIIRGNRQRAEMADAQLELRRLEQEIAQRRATTRRLVAALGKAATAADAATGAQQAQLLRQLQAEQAALKAAAERLEAMQRRPPE